MAASSDTATKSSGIGLTGALFLVFLTLKLTGYIDWSWWLVTAPLWFPLVAAVGFLATALLISLLVAVIKR